MSLSSRTVIFIGFTLMTAVTVQSVGMIEQSSVFNEQINEYRALQLANSLDVFSDYEKGEMEKTFNDNYTIDIDTSEAELTFSPPDSGSITVNMESDTMSDLDGNDVNINANVICVEKESPDLLQPNQQLLTIEAGDCG